MLRAPALLLAVLSLVVPAHVGADTKAEKAAKKNKAKAKKAKAEKAKADADAAAADTDAAAGTDAVADTDADPAAPLPADSSADADLLKTKADTDAEAEQAKAAAEAEAKAAAAKDEQAKVGTILPLPLPPPTAGLTVGKGRFVISGSTVNVNLSADTAAKPVSLAPSVWFGITDTLSIGVTHDGGTTTWTPRPGVKVTTQDLLGTIETTVTGSGVCVTGKDGNCKKPYNNVGADILFGVLNGTFSFAAHVGLDVLGLDELTMAARIGGLGRYAVGSKLSIVFDPRVQIGVTDRDFNGESLDVPLWIWFLPTAKLGAYVHTGFAGPFDGLADSFNVPIGVGTTWFASRKLAVGADVHFTNLLGKGSSADGRVLGVRLALTL